MTLTDIDRALLAIEGRPWVHAGAKEQVIRDLGLSETRAAQRLLQILGEPAAWEHDPVTMGLVRRRVEGRRRGRRAV